jgi:ubiquinone/menaquinone biosynthesis C-methylase UbiE
MSFEKIYPAGCDTGTFHNLRKRLNLVSELLAVNGKRILDCGCGQGSYLLGLLSKGGDAFGIEYSYEKVSAFQEEYPHLAERISQGDIESIDYKNNVFDIAFVNEVLEHVTDEKKALHEIHRILKSDGDLILSPNRYYPFEMHALYWKANGKSIPHHVPFIPYIPVGLGKKYLTYMARNYWPSELRRLVKDAGFQIIRVGHIWQTFKIFLRLSLKS